MIKRALMVVISLAALLSLSACESAGQRAERSGTQVEDRADRELESGVDQALDRVFDGR